MIENFKKTLILLIGISLVLALFGMIWWSQYNLQAHQAAEIYGETNGHEINVDDPQVEEKPPKGEASGNSEDGEASGESETNPEPAENSQTGNTINGVLIIIAGIAGIALIIGGILYVRSPRR